MNNVERFYRHMLASLKKHGDIVDYKVWRDGDDIHALIKPLPTLHHITIDKDRYKAAINAIVDGLQDE